MAGVIKLWLISKPWFWKFRAKCSRDSFVLERTLYSYEESYSKTKNSAFIFWSVAWIGLKNLSWVILALLIFGSIEDYIRSNSSLLVPLSKEQIKFNIDQLRLYAQMLTAIFSIYFATIGIILSTGYTKLRRDIIQLLVNEQVGNVYSRLLVFSAIFCLCATTFESFGLKPSFLVYAIGTLLTAISSLTLFPLGQRLFNFFDLNQLARSEVLPRIVRNIENAAKSSDSISLANHHSKKALLAFKQFCYIDNQVKTDTSRLSDNLPALSRDYSELLQYYLSEKHKINHQSYWFPRRKKHEQWFLAGDFATHNALQTSSQLATKEEIHYQWLENDITERLAQHIELAFETGDLKLGLELLGKLSSRINVYANQLQFEIGIREIQRVQKIIETAFSVIPQVSNDEEMKLLVAIADMWAALGSSLCLETLRRMITFEKELAQFFINDIWTKKSLQSLPALLQVELAFIVKFINFENNIEGKRLSKPKFVQQLAVQSLLRHYAKTLQEVIEFHTVVIPSFIASLEKMKMTEAATQVILASLHNYWKLPRWFDSISELIDRYNTLEHHSEKEYAFQKIDIKKMNEQLISSREKAIEMLSQPNIVEHIFKNEYNDELPDHFGHVYFQLAEACIEALEENSPIRFNRTFPMFMAMAFQASDSKFIDKNLELNDEYRLHLISSVFKDIMSILGIAILYSAYFDNSSLSMTAIDQFNSRIENTPNKKLYLKRMVILSESQDFSFSASPRDRFRLNWKMSFEQRMRNDGYGNSFSLDRGKEHGNKIVNAFTNNSFAEVYHLFIAVQILPQIAPLDFEINHYILSIADRLSKYTEEAF
ncbi:hypothetical protein [Vibrio scophthalmi]|uniref:DUF2254 domain-containing protein n=1 Tax=Vibrio scophthalmi TaxID=45658 RepID=A0A1E3WGX6_9VIBR|nr:hypothetical protein [Vibrio scophthalmi]ODS05051.1 hypothetical protein VSF3289_04191 [Vibrio scophthalmi]